LHCRHQQQAARRLSLSAARHRAAVAPKAIILPLQSRSGLHIFAGDMPRVPAVSIAQVITGITLVNIYMASAEFTQLQSAISQADISNPFPLSIDTLQRAKPFLQHYMFFKEKYFLI